ncbi:MAG TPA: hypothetical protein VK966_09070 [Longimicrobiales bacterium]|nr:hypothetical protein [Longimicrobiales bacterium]
MRDLMNLVRGSDGRGLLLHINNLETLTERDASNAAEILRGLRDPMLMHPGLHVVLVGTPDAVSTVVNTHPQVRSIFTTVPIAPLGTEHVHAMLAARYEYLRYHSRRPVIPPAESGAVELMYSLYRGDLRGMLKALEDGTSALLGLVPAADGGGPRPMTGEDLRPVLKERYGRELDALPEQTRVEQLRAWAEADPEAVHTQQTLQEVWGIAQPSVSTALKYLIQQGLVVALPREGRQPIRYVLSGTSLLIFGGSSG